MNRVRRRRMARNTWSTAAQNQQHAQRTGNAKASRRPATNGDCPSRHGRRHGSRRRGFRHPRRQLSVDLPHRVTRRRARHEKEARFALRETVRLGARFIHAGGRQLRIVAGRRRPPSSAEEQHVPRTDAADARFDRLQFVAAGGRPAAAGPVQRISQRRQSRIDDAVQRRHIRARRHGDAVADELRVVAVPIVWRQRHLRLIAVDVARFGGHRLPPRVQAPPVIGFFQPGAARIGPCDGAEVEPSAKPAPIARLTSSPAGIS